jgi:uncharacterized UPF0146 family protein
MLAFRCPEDLADAAVELAKAEERSLSNYLKILLKDAVARSAERENYQPSSSNRSLRTAAGTR